MGAREQADARRVRVVGGEGPSTRTVEEGVSAHAVETVPSVATLTPATVAAVVVVAPAVDVPAATAVERVRRLHGETPVVVAVDEVTAIRADAVVPVEADAVERTVQQVLDAEFLERTRRRVGRVVALASDLEEGDDVADVCERLAEGVGYDTAWLVRREEAAVTPVAAAGVPLSALRDVEADADAPWARALRTGEPVVEGGDGYTVTVPFGERCLVCTTDTSVGEAEVSALEHVLRSVPATAGTYRPRYALLGEAIAHEVNNQLDVAMVHLDLLEAADDHLDHVETALERIDAVVDEVNALVAPELSAEPVSLGEVAGDVWSGVSTDAATLEVHDGTVEADDRLLRLLLSNLFRNAIQHGGEAVTVEVGPLDGGGLYVADDGVGFADGAGERLFEWGWSAADGAGIGLALVSLVADRHDWTVEHRDDGGARFEFRP